MKIEDFRDLDVYQRAFRCGMEIYRLSKGWPPEERYGLTSQVRDASRSVCANISEAWRKRTRYPASFISKLSDAESEAAETVVWLEFGKSMNLISALDADRLIDEYDHICAQLMTMMEHPEKWCPADVLVKWKH